MVVDRVGGSPELSAAVFGNKHAAIVLTQAARLAADGVITTRRIASRTGIADSLVRAVLLRFVAAEVLDAVPRLANEREQYYVLRDTALARAVIEAAQTVVAEDSTARMS